MVSVRVEQNPQCVRWFRNQLRVRVYTFENITCNYKLLLISTVSLQCVS